MGHRLIADSIRMLLLLFLLELVSDVISLGSSFLVGSHFYIHMKELCSASFFDISAGDLKIGTYHDQLQGLGDYQNRLRFIKENCTVIINLLHEVSQNFTVTVGSLVNDVIKEYSETFPARIPETLTSIAITTCNNTLEDTSGNLTACILSLCFSVYPATSGLVSLLACITALCSSVKVFKNVHKSLLGGRLQKTLNRVCFMNRFVSLICQLVSLALWSVCGCLERTGWISVILCTSISTAVLAYFACPWGHQIITFLRTSGMKLRPCFGHFVTEQAGDGAKCNHWWILCHLCFTVIPEIAFTALAFSFSTCHGFTHPILGIILSFLVSMFIVGLIFLYCWKRNTTEDNSGAADPESNKPGAEPSPNDRLLENGKSPIIGLESLSTVENDVENNTEHNNNTDDPVSNVPPGTEPSPNQDLLSPGTGQMSS